MSPSRSAPSLVEWIDNEIFDARTRRERAAANHATEVYVASNERVKTLEDVREQVTGQRKGPDS
jgi:hypothetical protein